MRLCCVLWVLALVVSQCVLMTMDVWVDLNASYALYNMPGRIWDIGLGYGSANRGKVTVVGEVTGFAVLADNSVVGRCRTGFFLADRSGRVRAFGTKAEMLSHLKGAGLAEAVSLRSAVRIRDPRIRFLESAWVGASIVTACVVWWARKRRRLGN